MYIIKGVRCKEQKLLTDELKSLPPLEDWNNLLNKRNKCIDKNMSGFSDLNCLESLNNVANVILFPQYSYLNSMTIYIQKKLNKYLSIENNLQQEISYVTEKENLFLKEERIEDRLLFEFDSYKLYSPSSSFPVFFETICSMNGIRLQKYQMDKEKVNEFRKHIKEMVKKETEERDKNLDLEIANQYEESLLEENQNILFVQVVLLLCLNFLLK